MSSNIYISCENMDLVFTKKEIIHFQKYWFKGVSLKKIAETLERDIDECALLLIDLAERNLVKCRNKGIEKSDVSFIPNHSRKTQNFINKIPKDYYCLEDYSLVWSKREVVRLKELWITNVPIQKISIDLARSDIEIAVLILDLHKKKEIKCRKGGLLGHDFIYTQV